MKLEEMSRTELVDMFISYISGHEKETEIAYTLGLFTAMKLSNESTIEYDVTEYDTDSLIDLIETGILNQNGAGFDEEEKVWNMVLDTLKPDKVFNIIDSIDHYMDRYNRIMQPIDDLEYTMPKIFVESEVK